MFFCADMLAKMAVVLNFQVKDDLSLKPVYLVATVILRSGNC